MIVLVMGGARSGKSDLAERCAAELAGPAGAVTYVATGVVTDDDFAARVAAHRVRRPATWTTVEAGADLVPALVEARTTALVDSLGTWVAAHADLHADPAVLVAALESRRARGLTTVLVSDEAGMGVHPATEVGRRFRDVLGEVNRAVAAIADRALLVVAGRALALGQTAGDDLAALLDLDGRGR